MAKKFRRRFQPYAIELGHLAYHWNRLHENLGRLFWTITGIANGVVAMNVWYSLRSDLAQREMLRAAAMGGLNRQAVEKARGEIKWLLDEVNTLSHQRNDALHAPLLFKFEPEDPRPIFESAYHFGNPRALKLKDKDLISEFVWYHERAAALADHASVLDLWIHRPEPTLPSRPKLPTRGQRKNHSSKPRHRQRTKSSPRQRQPSRA